MSKRKWLERFLPMGSTFRTILEWLLLIVLFVLVLVGCLSLPISIWWQIENVGNQSHSIPLGNNQTIAVDYPAMVLIEDKPAQLSFSLSSPQPLDQPLTVTVQLPRELLLATSSQAYRDAEPVLTFTPLAARVQTQTLQIANARLVEGYSQQQKIILALSNGSEQALPITIEGTLRAALRGFFSNQFNIIITAFLTSAGLVYTFFEKRQEREAEEKKSRERREKAKEGKDRFRQLMRQQNCSLAKEVLQGLEKQSFMEFIAPDDQVWMKRLTQWSQGNLAELTSETIPPDWLNEVAGALGFAFNEGQTKTPEIKTFLRQLPEDKLSDDVRNAVQAAIDLPEQSRSWPLRLEKPDLGLIALDERWKSRLDVNPFPYEHAEEDFPLLFSEVGAFWDGHPLYKRLTATAKTELIAGEAGVGKTAMALALGEYLHDEKTLACYLPGLPEESDLQRALAKKILAFVCRHPTFLRKLGQDSRALLARVCTNPLGTQLVLATLDSVPVEDMQYVKEGQDQKDRQRRENSIRSQLRLFRDTIISLPADQPYSFYEWSGAFAQCARALGFALPIRVVIDASGKQCAEWMNQSILPRVPLWSREGIVTKIFVSAGIESIIKFPDDHLGWLVSSQLEWDASLLSQMLDYRFKSIMIVRNSRVERPEIASDELWNQTITKANANPRCFIRLWNRMLDLATGGVLDEPVLAKALEGFECP